MQFLGYIFQHKIADEANEPLWCNSINGNRHQRVFGLERIIANDDLIAYSFYLGKHQIRWAKLAQMQKTT